MQCRKIVLKVKVEKEVHAAIADYGHLPASVIANGRVFTRSTEERKDTDGQMLRVYFQTDSQSASADKQGEHAWPIDQLPS